MKRLLLALLAFGSASLLIAQFAPLKETPQFRAAQVLSVSDLPLTTTGYIVGGGTAVLDALIDETGHIEQLEIRRDVPGLTKLVLPAVKGWEFSPATMGGKAIPSRVPIAVCFRPPYLRAAAMPLPPLIAQSEPAIQAEFQPVEVLRDAFPEYPITTEAIGTVVLGATIDESGEVGEITVLRDLSPLTDVAKAAVANWRFMAATLNGAPVPSKIILAFVFPAIIASP